MVNKTKLYLTDEMIKVLKVKYKGYFINISKELNNHRIIKDILNDNFYEALTFVSKRLKAFDPSKSGSPKTYILASFKYYCQNFNSDLTKHKEKIKQDIIKANREEKLKVLFSEEKSVNLQL